MDGEYRLAAHVVTKEPCEFVSRMVQRLNVLIGRHAEDTEALVGASDQGCQGTKRMFLSIASGRVARTRALE